jgi:hypothetical protein
LRISVPGINPLNRYPKKNEAIRNIVNGLIAQLINSVRATGLGVLATAKTFAKSIFTIIGYIIKNRHTAIGMDTSYMEKESSLTESSGAALPSRMPPPIHSNTQSVKYLSKTDNLLVLLSIYNSAHITLDAFKKLCFFA